MFLITESDFFNFAIILYHSFNSISSYQAWSSYTVKEKRLKELDSIFNNLFNLLLLNGNHTLIIPFYKYENRCEYHLAQLKPTLVRLYMILLFVVF